MNDRLGKHLAKVFEIMKDGEWSVVTRPRMRF
jgi:hypothetical protein